MAATNPVSGRDARPEARSQKITTFLWFDNNAEEAANFYVSVFKNSRILKTSRYPEGSPAPGAVMTVDFELDGQQFIALNGGPHFKFTEAISLMVHCYTQEEVDYYWEKLTADGGQESQCGWLKDKFGLSWQITPDELMKVWTDRDPATAQRVMQAMMGMKKLIIKDLEAAAAG